MIKFKLNLYPTVLAYKILSLQEKTSQVINRIYRKIHMICIKSARHNKKWINIYQNNDEYI